MATHESRKRTTKAIVFQNKGLMIRQITFLFLLTSATVSQAKLPEAIDLGEGRQPRLALTSDDKAYAVFGSDGVYCRRSDDGGTSWSAPIRVETLTGKMPLGMRRGPRVCVAGDAVVITEITGEKGGGADGDLVAVRSTDEGRTWSKPIAISDVPRAAREGLQGLASDGRDQIAAVWLDDRDGKKTVMSAVSRDRGKSWSANVLVYASPDGHVCECCHPSVVFDSSGDIHVMFRNWIGGNRDMYLASSHDSGKTWTPAAKLGAGTWPLNACPMDGGEIASLRTSVVTAWQRNGLVFRTPPDDSNRELSLGSGRQPSVATTAGGAWFAYLNGTALTIVPAEGDRFVLAPHAEAPVLAAAGSRVLCAWESQGHSFVAVLTN